jgi:adenine-specific DNA glycosylase
MKKDKAAALKELQKIPGVGKSVAGDFWELGLRSVKDLIDKNPERLYQKLCDLKKTPIDRCMLYVCRCAVYYASNRRCQPELLKWWNWKDR